MPRKYSHVAVSRPYRNYNVEQLDLAVTAIKNGLSKKKASQMFGIPRATFINKVIGLHIKTPGGQTVLRRDEEIIISETLTIVAMWGFPLTKPDAQAVVKKYLDKKGANIKMFKDNLPGSDFIDGFIRGNNLSMHLAANIKTSCAIICPEVINNFFDNIKNVLENANPKNLYNYDETNVTDDPGAKKVVVQWGLKKVERVQDHSKQTISSMV